MARTSRSPLSRPNRHLGRMLVFLILSGFIVFILQKQIIVSFRANPGLNALIIGLLLIGIFFALQQVIRLYPEIRWVNALARSSAENPLVASEPSLLAPMAAVLSNHTYNQPLSINMTRSLLDSVGSRLDEGREILRYLAGLLIFLGLLGTFWGLIETIGSVGDVISSLGAGSDAIAMFDNLKQSLTKPLQGMRLSFSASLFGLSGSLILGFLDLQAGQAQNLFYNELEEWLSSATSDAERSYNAISSPELLQTLERLTQALNKHGQGGADTADEKLQTVSESIKILAQTVHSEQRLLKGWMETQMERDKDLRSLINLIIQRGTH